MLVHPGWHALQRSTPHLLSRCMGMTPAVWGLPHLGVQVRSFHSPGAQDPLKSALDSRFDVAVRLLLPDHMLAFCRLSGPRSACSLSASQRTSLCYPVPLKCRAYPSNSLAIGPGDAIELSAAPTHASSLATATDCEIIRATHPGEPGSLEIVPACNTAQAWRQPWGMLKTYLAVSDHSRGAASRTGTECVLWHTMDQRAVKGIEPGPGRHLSEKAAQKGTAIKNTRVPPRQLLS
jgi:hypothetical protein